MHFYRKLYVGESIKYPELVKWRLRHYAGQLSVYVLTMPEQGCMPELMHSAFLKQPWYRNHPPMILGIASGKTEALELLRQIVQEAVDATGSPDVRSYLFPHGILKNGRGTEVHG